MASEEKEPQINADERRLNACLKILRGALKSAMFRSGFPGESL